MQRIGKFTATGGAGPQPLLERLAACLLAAVIIARLLTPTDGVITGETLWIAQFSLLVPLFWVFSVYRTGVLRLKFEWLDGAAALLCLGHIVGALVVVATAGDKRAALTMLWEWCGIAATFFLMRQLLASPAARQSMLLCVAATGVSLSGLGLWQHYGGFAETRREYESKKSELIVLERQGRPKAPEEAIDWDRAMHRVRRDFVRMGIPVDRSSQILWEQRLNSSEPFGLFALANTLAGLLVSTAIIWLGTLVYNSRNVARWQIAWGAGLVALILYCLLLTKSRTAFVGFVAGLSAWAAAVGWRQPTMRRKLAWGVVVGVVVVVVLIAVTAATGGLDQFVVSESAKSLRYRFEYWTATWRMLADRNWLLGVGPGNFRQHYLPFKLPQSSEEIADPHNMLLDVWANGGLIALVGLIGVCAAGLRPFWNGSAAAEMGPAVSRSANGGGCGTLPSWTDGILLGGILAHLVVLSSGGRADSFIMLVLLGWLCVVSACRNWFRYELPRIVPAAAFMALAVHLLGAGGIGMPGICLILLLFAVLDAPSLVQSDEAARGRFHQGWEVRTNSRWAMTGVGLAGLGLYLGCWFTGLTPVLNARNLIAAGERELFEEGRPPRAERNFRAAATADPLASEPWEKLAQLRFQYWLAAEGEHPEQFEKCVAWQHEAIARNPHDAGVFRTLGGMYLSKFNQTGDLSDASSAADAFQQAIALYANHAQTQSELAEALWKGGLVERARDPAGWALALDAINERAGHIDKLLPAPRRELMSEILRIPNAN